VADPAGPVALGNASLRQIFQAVICGNSKVELRPAGAGGGGVLI